MYSFKSSTSTMHIFTDDFTLIFGPCTMTWITCVVTKIDYNTRAIITSAYERAKRWYDYHNDVSAIIHNMTPTTLNKLCDMLSKYRCTRPNVILVSYSDQLEIMDLIGDLLY